MQLDRPFLALTPTIDGDVLAALARADGPFGVSQLQRIIGQYSIVGIRKVLVRLVEQGTVTATTTANSVSYRLNRQHLLAEAVLSIADAKARLFERLEDHMSGWPDEIRYCAVFGSTVVGEMRPGSDVDLLVVHADDDGDVLWDRLAVELEQSVHAWTGNALSIFAMTVDELTERRRDQVVRDIATSSRTVRGSRAWFERALRAGGSHAHA